MHGVICCYGACGPGQAFRRGWKSCFSPNLLLVPPSVLMLQVWIRFEGFICEGVTVRTEKRHFNAMRAKVCVKGADSSVNRWILVCRGGSNVKSRVGQMVQVEQKFDPNIACSPVQQTSVFAGRSA